jgi:GNAT superfamily N-acetyltransferase
VLPFIAYDEDKAIGYLFCILNTLFTATPIACIEQFFVINEYRASRVGRQLLLEAIKLAKTMGCGVMYAEIGNGVKKEHITLRNMLFKNQFVDVADKQYQRVL